MSSHEIWDATNFVNGITSPAEVPRDGYIVDIVQGKYLGIFEIETWEEQGPGKQNCDFKYLDWRKRIAFKAIVILFLLQYVSNYFVA